MKPALLAPFRNKKVVLTIEGERNRYFGTIIALDAGGVVLKSDKFGLTSVDCRYIISCREERRDKRCQEESENHFQKE